MARTLAEVIEMQRTRDRLYQEVWDEYKLSAAGERSRLAKAWARYCAFCAKVDAAKRELLGPAETGLPRDTSS